MFTQPSATNAVHRHAALFYLRFYAGPCHIAVRLAGFDADKGGGADAHDSARILFLATDGSIVDETYVDAGAGTSFTFDGLSGVAAIVFQAGAEAADGSFVAGALSDAGAPTTDLASGFLVDSLKASGPETFIA